MSGLAIQTRGVGVVIPPTDPISANFCACDFWCEWEEQVFADPAGVGVWAGDKTSFLARKLTSGDTLSIKLFREGAEVATISNSTYGTYYSSFLAQPLYVGWVADWTLIYNAFSGGQYYVTISGTLAGNAYSFTSRKFRVSAWNEELADGTVKVESYQSGDILSSEFDFSGLISGGWYSAIRLDARFGKRTPTLEVDEFLNTSYQSVQNRTQVRHEYTLQTRYLPVSILNSLSDVDLIGNELFLTDYSLMSEDKYKRLPVVAQAYDETEINDWTTGRGRYTVTFTDRKQNNIKRNF